MDKNYKYIFCMTNKIKIHMFLVFSVMEYVDGRED
jgi:hypothetical protein